MRTPGRILLLLIMVLLVAASPARSGEVRYGTNARETKRMETSPYDHIKRVYIHGGYNIHFSSDLPDGQSANGQAGWFGGLGARWTQSVRTELTFEQFVDDWADLGRTHGYFGFFNVMFDARVDGAYQRYVSNPFMPFVGFGAGAGVYDFTGLEITQARRTNFAYNFIAGFSVDLNRTVALVLSYRYARVVSANNFNWETGHDELVLDANGDQVLDANGDPTYNTIVTPHDVGGFRPTVHNIGLSLRMSF